MTLKHHENTYELQNRTCTFQFVGRSPSEFFLAFDLQVIGVADLARDLTPVLGPLHRPAGRTDDVTALRRSYNKPLASVSCVRVRVCVCVCI